MTPALKLRREPRQSTFDLGRRPGVAGRRVQLTERELMHHTLMLGTTGSGKTTAAMSILTQAVADGWGVVMLDLKGDPDNAAHLAGAAADAGCSYHQYAISPGERADEWHPLHAGDPAARMSKVICLSQWTEPYYQSACERFAQLAFVLMERNDIEPGFEALVDLLDDPSRCTRLVTALGDGEQGRVSQYVKRLLEDKGQLSALAGLAARIGTLTDPGGPLRTRDTAREQIDLHRLSRDGGVVCFSLNSARSAVAAAQIGALAILDVQSMVAQRITSGQITRPVIVCVDEFSVLDSDHLLGLFARARSSRVAMLLATQELADLSRVDDGFADQIMGLTMNKLILRQEVATSAEVLARTVGTQRVWKASRQTERCLFGSGRTGKGNERAADEFIQHPNVFKRLRRGEAVLLRKDPFRVERVNVTPHVADPDHSATVQSVPAPAGPAAIRQERIELPVRRGPISNVGMERLFPGRTL